MPTTTCTPISRNLQNSSESLEEEIDDDNDDDVTEQDEEENIFNPAAPTLVSGSGSGLLVHFSKQQCLFISIVSTVILSAFRI